MGAVGLDRGDSFFDPVRGEGGGGLRLSILVAQGDRRGTACSSVRTATTAKLVASGEAAGRQLHIANQNRYSHIEHF